MMWENARVVHIAVRASIFEDKMDQFCLPSLNIITFVKAIVISYAFP